MTAGDQISSRATSSSRTPHASGGGARVTAAAVTMVGLTATTVAVSLSPATVARGPGLCPFARMTGLPCPACGLTRSWVALGHGDLVGSVNFNWFGPLFMVVTVVVTGVAMWTAITGGSSVERVRRVLTSRAALALVAVWFGYGLVRMLDAGFGWGIFQLVV